MQNLSPTDQKRKRALLINRIFGVVVSIAIFVLLLCYYFKIIDEWVFSICSIMLSATNFITCASVLKISGKDTLTTANLFLSIIFFLLGIGIMVYGIVSGNLLLPF